MNEFLPEPLPSTPLDLFADWFAEARQRRVQQNPDAMVLATVDARGTPSARVVLCKAFDAQQGYVVFYTNYSSRKGSELAANPRAAAVFHWNAMQRQVRMEGRIVASPPEESDAYFASRPVASRIGAWASAQSRPLSSRAQLQTQVDAMNARFGVKAGDIDGHVPRPAHWGGYRLWAEFVELWVEGPGRVHDRARWSRSLAQRDAYHFDASPWQATRLNP